MKSVFNGQQLNIPHSRADASSVQVKEGVEQCRTESTSGENIITKSQQVSNHTYHSSHQIIGQSDIGEVFTPCTVSRHISSLISVAPNLQYSQAVLESCNYAANEYDRLSAAKAPGNLQLVLDEHEEDDDSSEAETYYSDSEISSDEDLVADLASDDLAARLKSLVFGLLDSGYSAGLFNSCGSGESATSRREGSVSNGPPSKRRSIGQGKSVPSPLDDDLDDDADEPEERRGQNIDEKSNAPFQSRKWFACQFFQRDPNRCINRSCSGPGWPALHRLK